MQRTSEGKGLAVHCRRSKWTVATLPSVAAEVAREDETHGRRDNLVSAKKRLGGN